MRTPGGDFELAVGFLFTEGLIAPGEVQRVAYCDTLPGEEQALQRRLGHAGPAVRRRGAPAELHANSSCGVCGKAALEDVEVRCEPVAPGPEVGLDVLVSLPDRLREAQSVFERTGGARRGSVLARGGGAHGPRGRGAAQRGRQGDRRPLPGWPGPGERDGPAGERPCVVRDRPEGRGGRDPDRERGERTSSLAVEAAERFSMTLVGFVREGRANVYTHPERIAP